jgi:hypothetical protein
MRQITPSAMRSPLGSRSMMSAESDMSWPHRQVNAHDGKADPSNRFAPGQRPRIRRFGRATIIANLLSQWLVGDDPPSRHLLLLTVASVAGVTMFP